MDAILLPEIPYDIKVVAKKIKENQKAGKEYTIIACAEGAISEEDSLLSKQKLQVAKDVRLLMKSLNNYKS